MVHLGILGISEGNGHPYSWAAIYNGYDAAAMADCPFPAIPAYLAKQRFPDDAISDARVTHVWTQDRGLSEHIARASRIAHVVDDARDMIGQVDGILLARDDADNHLAHAAPFLEAGLPIFIDKPLALSVATANELYAHERYPGQIFTCSALRYAAEFQLDDVARAEIGDIRYVQATAAKDWDRYAVHVIEPVLAMLGSQGPVRVAKVWNDGGMTVVHLCWDSGRRASFTTLGAGLAGPIALQVVGTKGYRNMVFRDSFAAFRAALLDFLRGIKERRVMAARDFVLDVVAVIEVGRRPA